MRSWSTVLCNGKKRLGAMVTSDENVRTMGANAKMQQNEFRFLSYDASLYRRMDILLYHADVAFDNDGRTCLHYMPLFDADRRTLLC